MTQSKAFRYQQSACRGVANALSLVFYIMILRRVICCRVPVPRRKPALIIRFFLHRDHFQYAISGELTGTWEKGYYPAFLRLFYVASLWKFEFVQSSDLYPVFQNSSYISCIQRPKQHRDLKKEVHKNLREDKQWQEVDPCGELEKVNRKG